METLLPIVIITAILLSLTVILLIADKLLVSYGDCKISVSAEEGDKEFNVQGGSTLTMQLARSLFLHHRREWTRKVREILLALQIERTYTKDEILEMYLNQIYLGNRAYGFEAASRAYFGKHVEEISLAEAALLAGIIKNPRDYPPTQNLDTATRRRGSG